MATVFVVGKNQLRVENTVFGKTIILGEKLT